MRIVMRFREGVAHEEESAVPEGQDEGLAGREHAIDGLAARVADAHREADGPDQPVREVGNGRSEGPGQSHAA
jgi:hypothetical protein